MNHYNLGTIRQHHLEPVCKRVALRIAKNTPRRPPPIHWTQGLGL